MILRRFSLQVMTVGKRNTISVISPAVRGPDDDTIAADQSAIDFSEKLFAAVDVHDGMRAYLTRIFSRARDCGHNRSRPIRQEMKQKALLCVRSA